MSKKCCSTCEYYSYHKDKLYPYKCAWNKFFEVRIDPDQMTCNFYDKKKEEVKS